MRKLLRCITFPFRLTWWWLFSGNYIHIEACHWDDNGNNRIWYVSRGRNALRPKWKE